MRIFPMLATFLLATAGCCGASRTTQTTDSLVCATVPECRMEYERLATRWADREAEFHSRLVDRDAKIERLSSAHARAGGSTEEELASPPPETTTAHRRRLAANDPSGVPTPIPTPLTPVPTPLTPFPSTAMPSSAPSASPVPTTEGVTTHSQLTNAVADAANAVVVIEAPVLFPSRAPIMVESGRSVSIVGRSAIDGGRVTLDGYGWSRHFYVIGGTLHLSSLNLVNGTAEQASNNCRPTSGNAPAAVYSWRTAGLSWCGPATSLEAARGSTPFLAVLSWERASWWREWLPRPTFGTAH